MKKQLFILLFILSNFNLIAQNLLSNGSFEQYTTCPNNGGQVYYCNNWSTNGTADYYNSCTTNPVFSVPTNSVGTQAAADGVAYTGIGSYTASGGREYIITFFTPLRVGDTYEMSLSLSLADNSKYAVDGFGVFFFDVTPILPTNDVVMPFTPQVSYNNYGIITSKTSWTRLSKTFVADSTYDNLIIGCFKDNSTINVTTLSGINNGAYYYVDSVVLKRLSNIHINYTTTPLCAGDTITVPYTLTGASGFFTGSNVFTLQLSGPTGSFATPVNIGSVTSGTAGAVQGIIPTGTVAGSGYRLRIISSLTADTSAANVQDITIKPLPLPTAGSNAPVCEAGILNLTASALPGSSFTWAGPVTVPAVQNPALTGVTAAYAGNYIVTASLNGCIASDTVTVAVKPLPSTPVAGSNSPLCEGDTLKLATSGFSPGVSFSWTGPATVPPVQNPVLLNASIAYNGTYTVTTTLNGCTSQSAVNVVIKPVPAIPVAGSNSPVCAGGILNLTASSLTPGINYDWTGPGGFSSTLQNPSINPVNAAHAGNYKVTAILNGCASAPGAATVTVNTVSYLGAYASPGDTICEGNMLTMVTVPTNGGSNPQFQWFKNGSALPGETKLTYSTALAATGDTFRCRMVASNSCNTPITLFSNKIGITVLPVGPAPAVSATASPASPLPGNPAVFTAHPINCGAAPAYQWLLNGTDMAGATAGIWSTQGLNPYDRVSVRVTSNDPCPKNKTALSDEITVNFPVSTAGIRTDVSALYIYPNPANGHFVLHGLQNREIVIDILNITGQVVYHRQHTPAGGIVYITIPAIPAGIYTVKAGREVRKLVIN